MQGTYLQNYRRLMQSGDDAQKNYIDDSENPLMVDNVLFNQLSASAIASHDWIRKNAQANVLQQHVMCPELPEYPVSPRTVRRLAELKKQCKKIYLF